MTEKRPATGTIDPTTARFARMQLERRTVTVQDADEDGTLGEPRDEERLYLLTWTPDSAGREHYARTEVLPVLGPTVAREVIRVEQDILDAMEQLAGTGIAKQLASSDFVTAQAEALP